MNQQLSGTMYLLFPQIVLVFCDRRFTFALSDKFIAHDVLNFLLGCMNSVRASRSITFGEQCE
jgi:hypothetical protein